MEYGSCGLEVAVEQAPLLEHHHELSGLLVLAGVETEGEFSEELRFRGVRLEDACPPETVQTAGDVFNELGDGLVGFLSHDSLFE